MGSSYDWGINPFQDFLFNSVIHNTDISDKELETDIYVGFATILEYFVDDERDIHYLDFEIRKKSTYFKVVAKNAITALWLSGIFPKNLRNVLETNEFVFENIKYRFNDKTKKLTYKLIKK